MLVGFSFVVLAFGLGLGQEELAHPGVVGPLLEAERVHARHELGQNRGVSLYSYKVENHVN